MAKPFCGILIGAEELKAIVLKPARKGYRLIGCGVHDLTTEERDNPGHALKVLLKKIKGHPDFAQLALPSQQAAIHQVTLPSTDPEELKSMARFEAERNIPFNAERHCIGHQALGEGGVSGTPVLLASADGPHVERAVQAAVEAKLHISGLNVASMCAMNALFHANEEIARNKTVALISIGLHAIDLLFSVHGRIVFSRSIPLGLVALIRDWSAPGMPGIEVDRAKAATVAKMIDMMDLEKNYSEGGLKTAASKAQGDAARAWAQRVILELRRSYDFARREMRCPPIEAIMLTGEGAILRNLPQYLYVNLNVEVSIVNPIATLPKADLKNLAFGGLELTAPFGAAIQGEIDRSYQLDLTPATYYRQVERRRLVRNLVTTGLLAVVTSGLGAASYLELKDNRSLVAQDYREANDELAPIVRDLREKEKQFSILQAFFDDPSGALPLLNHLAGYPGFATDQIAIREIKFDKAQDRPGEAVVRGYAKTNEDLTAFYDYLNASGLFSDKVSIQSRTLKEIMRNLPQVYEFDFRCPLPEFKPDQRRRSQRRTEGAGESIASQPAVVAPPSARETQL